MSFSDVKHQSVASFTKQVTLITKEGKMGFGITFILGKLFTCPQFALGLSISRNAQMDLFVVGF